MGQAVARSMTKLVVEGLRNTRSRQQVHALQFVFSHVMCNFKLRDVTSFVAWSCENMFAIPPIDVQ